MPERDAERRRRFGFLDDARRMSLTDFDQNRPLWEAALVEGLPGGQAAFLLKLHHSIADGQATVLIGLNLFEFAADENPAEPPPPPAPPAEDVGVRDVTGAVPVGLPQLLEQRDPATIPVLPQARVIRSRRKAYQ